MHFVLHNVFFYSAERDVQLIFDKSHSSKKELLKIERAALVDKYSRTEGDTGSLEIQGMNC